MRYVKINSKHVTITSSQKSHADNQNRLVSTAKMMKILNKIGQEAVKRREKRTNYEYFGNANKSHSKLEQRKLFELTSAQRLAVVRCLM